MSWSTHTPARSIALAGALLAACGGKTEEQRTQAPAGQERPPVLRFEGYVYVEPSASDFQILERVKQQSLSAFPGLRKSRVLATKREVQSPSVDAFKREVVTVVGPGTEEQRAAIRVRYRYVTRADVARSGGERREIPLAVLHRTRGVDEKRVVRECTTSNPQDRRSESSIAIDFDPTLDTCKAAIQAEQAAIDAARAKLPPGSSEQVPVEEAERLYLPLTVTLEALPADAQPGTLPRFDPFDGPPGGAAAAQPHLPDPSIPSGDPGVVIVDPDLARPRGEAAAAANPGQGQGQAAAPAAPARDPREPAVVAPAAPPVAAAPAPVPPKQEEGLAERAESMFGEIFQLKFLAVWMSLLLVIPVLLGDRRDRKKQKAQGEPQGATIAPFQGRYPMSPPAGRATPMSPPAGRPTTMSPPRPTTMSPPRPTTMAPPARPTTMAPPAGHPTSVAPASSGVQSVPPTPRRSTPPDGI